jgi:hypothetical protein
VHTIIAHSNNIYTYIYIYIYIYIYSENLAQTSPTSHFKVLSFSMLNDPTLNVKIIQETGNSANVVFLITSRQIQGH